MNAYLIYKQTVDMDGNIIKIDNIEIDMNDINAAKYAKLFNLQIPTDLREYVSFQYISINIEV